MTMTYVWAGVALWLVLNAAIAARCRYVALPAKTASARIHDNQQRREKASPALSFFAFSLIFGMIR